MKHQKLEADDDDDDYDDGDDDDDDDDDDDGDDDDDDDDGAAVPCPWGISPFLHPPVSSNMAKKTAHLVR